MLGLFGSPRLERLDGMVATGRAVQRHRMALLALLASAPSQRLSRDKLIAWLWPDSDTDRGRNLLNVALYNLRKTLGEAALLSSGDDLQLNGEMVRVDLLEFEQALEREDHAAAASLYRGPFLDGFFLADSTEFEQWTERERARLADAHGTSLEALAEDAEAQRDWTGAMEWWRAKATLDPYDSRVALRLMAALEAGGNRAGALHHAQTHQRLLRSELGVDAAEVAALAERLRQAPAPPSALPEAPRLDQETPAPAVAPPRRGARVVVLTLAGLVLLVIGAYALWPRSHRPEGSVAVLPFVNLSASPDNEFFTDGLTEEVIARLAVIPDLKVISRTSAMHYKGSRKTLREIAAELGVAHVLEGSVRESGGSLRISAQLVDAGSDAHLWAHTYEHELEAPFRIQEEIASAVAQALELELGERTRRLLGRQGTGNPDALEFYRRGRFLWNMRTREAQAQALVFFERAIALDSAYGDAYSGLADTYLTSWQLNMSDRSEAEAAARHRVAAERAIALDPESADARVSFGVALWWQRDWPVAERELLRALDLNPGHATARIWYSLLLRGMGRSEEAVEQSRRSVELDPFGMIPNTQNAWQSYSDRDWDRSLAQYRRATQISTYGGPWAGVGLSLARKGQYDSALAAIRAAIGKAPERGDFVADLAYVQALAGDRAAARETLREAVRNPFEPFRVACAWVGLGEADSAFAWLERARWHWPHRAALSDPALDPIRADPRFARLAEKVGRAMGLDAEAVGRFVRVHTAEPVADR
jgi:TolB-like protein/DNA-binding SARP family transcriptional activator/Tfp pilus assembly protein PilF